MERLRQRSSAQKIRRLLYRHLVGGTWPLSFVRPPGSPQQTAAESLYIHIPFCRSLCAHCPYLKVLYEPQKLESYRTALLRELAEWSSAAPSRPILHLYFGGGSPSLFPDLIAECIEALAPRLNAGSAVGVEVHPLDAKPNALQAFRSLGVTRISLGIESLSAEALQLLGRGYRPEAARQALEAAAGAGFECVDVNLIYGIGGLDVDDILRDAEACIAAGANQISAYPMISFRHTRPSWIPTLGDFLKRDRSQRGLRTLCLEHGWEQTSVWSFSQPGVEPYSTVTLENYRGFGAGAATRRPDAFWFHTFDVGAYAAAGGARPALEIRPDDRFFRAHWLYWKIYGLRIPGKSYADAFGVRPEDDFRNLFRWMRLLGIARMRGADWIITHRGADWVHRVQQLYSLSWIDQFWTRCMEEAWPEKISLS